MQKHSHADNHNTPRSFQIASAPAENGDSLVKRADALLDEMMVAVVDTGTHLDFPLPDPSQKQLPAHAQPAITQPALPPPALSQESQHPALEPMPRKSVGSANGASASAPERSMPALVPAEQRYRRPATAAVELPASTLPASTMPASTMPASTMAVGGTRSSLRSALLPRAGESNTAALAQKIHAMLGEIAATLPDSHDTAARGRTLLHKAQQILQSDPQRTAEVDYYLQQVRRILQRARQRQSDSALYRRWLTLYLCGWAGLAGLTLLSRYLFQEEWLNFLADFFWTGTDTPWVQYGPLVLGASLAGALGAACGALLTMQRHAARAYGYFDRKYGLRGLLLPLLGALLGLLPALLWAGSCSWLGLAGTELWVGLLPALLAWMLGFAQEWLYGAR
ncbi:MAG: hypothetical protein ACKO4U_16435 [Caldilinea sp.]